MCSSAKVGSWEIGINLLNADNFEEWFLSLEVLGETVFAVSTTCDVVRYCVEGSHRRARCSVSGSGLTVNIQYRLPQFNS